MESPIPLQNATEVQIDPTDHFLLVGPTGSGKTSQFLTFPGKKFAYLFDSNAKRTLQGQDVDFIEFLPDNVSVTPSSLKAQRTVAPRHHNTPGDLYDRWEEHFEWGCSNGFFDQYDVIAIDSFTTLSDMVMDKVLELNKRPGQWPQQDDYAPQMLVLRNIMRRVNAMNLTLFVMAHMETKQADDMKMYNFPLMTGRLRERLPLLFSEILVCSADTSRDGKTKWTVQTRPDRMNRAVRCTVRDAPFLLDVTLDWKKPLQGQGLAKWYRS